LAGFDFIGDLRAYPGRSLISLPVSFFLVSWELVMGDWDGERV
jgi:hypothetical protein